MELVLLQDVQSSYGANWARIANTEGVSEIQIKDRFREQGFGPGAEELEVAGIDISPVGGFSRLFFNRGANATQPEVHRLGAVLHKTSEPEAVPVPGLATAPVDQAASEPTPSEYAALRGGPELAQVVATANEINEALAEPKRRGRPVGSKNKPKELATSAAGKAFGLD